MKYCNIVRSWSQLKNKTKYHCNISQNCVSKCTRLHLTFSSEKISGGERVHWPPRKLVALGHSGLLSPNDISCIEPCESIFIFLLFDFHYSHTESHSTSDQKTGSYTKDQMRGTDVAPPPSLGYKTAESASWLSSITTSTFRNKQPKDKETAPNTGNSLIAKFRLTNSCIYYC